jgi:hypothetical protein
VTDAASSADERREQWTNLLREAARHRSSPVIAQTFINRWPSFSRPVALGCSDGNEYVVKGQHAGRAIINDQVIAHLGTMLGAPVGQPRIVVIPAELKDIEPLLADITEGTAHGTLLIRNCSDRQWLTYTDLVENRERFALLAVLYGWCYAGDHQLIYANAMPNLVYSVDHGHFFPGGPEWRTETLSRAARAELYEEIVRECQLTSAEQLSALLALEKMDDETIIQAVSAPPDDWGITMNERLALVDFLVRRRVELLDTLA